MKKLVALFLCLMTPESHLPSVYTTYGPGWGAIELAVDYGMSEQKIVVDCERHIWMKDATVIQCKANRMKEGWVVSIIPTSLFAGDTLFFLVPKGHGFEAYALNCYASGIAFSRGSIPIYSGRMTLNRDNLKSGENFSGTFSITTRDHKISGSFSGIAE